MSFAIALSDDAVGAGRRPVRPARAPRRAGADPAPPDGRRDAVHRADRAASGATCPSATAPWTAVWAQWRRWRANGVWAAAMARLAAIVRLLHDREPIPSMVMVDAQTVKGARYGPTFHEAGGRGGRTIGTKRTLLVEILGLPVAAAACSARPHDVVAGRELLRDRLADLAARSARSSATVPIAAWPSSRRASTSRSTSRRRQPGVAASPRSGRSTRSSTRSPSSGAGGACRAATRAARRAPALGSKSPRSATSPGAPRPDPVLRQISCAGAPAQPRRPTDPGIPSRPPSGRSPIRQASGLAPHPVSSTPSGPVITGGACRWSELSYKP